MRGRSKCDSGALAASTSLSVSPVVRSILRHVCTRGTDRSRAALQRRATRPRPMTKVAPAGTVGGCNGETYIFAPSHDGQFGKALTAAQPRRCAHFVEAIHLPLGNTCLRKLRLRCAIEVEQGCAAQGPPPTRHTVPARLSASGWVSPPRRPHAGPSRDARTVARRSRTISACPAFQPAQPVSWRVLRLPRGRRNRTHGTGMYHTLVSCDATIRGFASASAADAPARTNVRYPRWPATLA